MHEEERLLRRADMPQGPLQEALKLERACRRLGGLDCWAWTGLGLTVMHAYIGEFMLLVDSDGEKRFGERFVRRPSDDIREVHPVLH
jgi:hypothetical protein